MAKRNFFNDLAEKVKDEETALMSEGLGSAEFTGHLNTGCLSLNALLSGTVFGGIPNNSITMLCGDPATGKTFILLGILKYFLDADPDSAAIFFEPELALRNEMATERGIDIARIIRSEPVTVQQFRNKAVQILDQIANMGEHPAMLMLLDSLGFLSTTKETTDMEKGEEKKDMTKAGLVLGAFRVLRPKLARMRIPLIFTNHTYRSVDQYGTPAVPSGGSGGLYSADTIVLLRKGSKLRSGEDKTVQGYEIVAKTFKSRLSRADQEVELKLTFEKGLDKYYGLREIATSGGVFEKKGNKLLLPGGASVFGKEIDEAPEQIFTDEILHAIDEVCKQIFQYGKGH